MIAGSLSRPCLVLQARRPGEMHLSIYSAQGGVRGEEGIHLRSLLLLLNPTIGLSRALLSIQLSMVSGYGALCHPPPEQSLIGNAKE